MIIRNKKGQGMLEYLILTALVAVLCISAVKGLGSSIKTRLENTSKRLTEEVPSDLRSFGSKGKRKKGFSGFGF